MRSLQGGLDAAAAQVPTHQPSTGPAGDVRHSFNNPTWSPEPGPFQPSPCSSSQAQSGPSTQAPSSVWETLQGPWDPSPSWWFSPLEANFEQGQACSALPTMPSGNTEAESIEPQLSGQGLLHPALSDASFQMQPPMTAQPQLSSPSSNSNGYPVGYVREQQPQPMATSSGMGRASLQGSVPSASIKQKLQSDVGAPYDPFQIRSTDPHDGDGEAHALLEGYRSAGYPQAGDKHSNSHVDGTLRSSCISSSSGSYRSARSSANLSSMLANACFSGKRQPAHHRPVVPPPWLHENRQGLASPEMSISPAARRAKRPLSPIGSRRYKSAAENVSCWPQESSIRPGDLHTASMPNGTRLYGDHNGRASQQVSSDPSQASASTSFSLQHFDRKPASPGAWPDQQLSSSFSGGQDSSNKDKALQPESAQQGCRPPDEVQSVSMLDLLRHHGGPVPEALAWAAVHEAARTLEDLHNDDLVHGAISLETISLDGSVRARCSFCLDCDS